MRATGFANNPDEVSKHGDLSMLALGEPVHHREVQRIVGGPSELAALVGAGGADIDDDGLVALRFEILAGADAYAIVPRAGSLGERVYAGPDTWILLTHTWRFGLGGARALDLGTGTGLAATFLTSRYATDVATDITDEAVATAQLSSHLLDAPARDRLTVIRADVGDGLRSGSFDLVVANAPWVPTSTAGGNVFADGGPSGSELPLRFLADGIRLLTDTGILVMLCADLRFADGRAPLRDTLAALRTEGYTTEIAVTASDQPFTFIDADAPAPLAGLTAADHVTVVVYRRPAEVAPQ